MRERDIERYLCKKAKAIGGEVRKVKWIGRRGAPDRLVMLPARIIKDHVTERRASGFFTVGVRCIADKHIPSLLVWVELKAPGKKAEPHQLREHKRMQAIGQRVEVIDSFEGVDKLLGGG